MMIIDNVVRASTTEV